MGDNVVTYRIDVLAEEPIMLAHLETKFSMERDLSTALDDTRAVLDSLDRPVFYILDLTDVKFGVNDVVSGANQGSRGEDPVWHHNNICGFVVVSRSQLVQMAARGLNSLPFGNIDAQVFETLDEALAYCRGQIRAG